MAMDKAGLKKAIYVWAQEHIAKNPKQPWFGGSAEWSWAQKVLQDPAVLEDWAERASKDPSVLNHVPGVIALYQSDQSLKQIGQTQEGVPDFYKDKNLPNEVLGVTGSPDDPGQTPDTRGSAAEALRRFADAMMKPPDMNDPYVKQIVTGAGNMASDQARMRGIGGGYSIHNLEQAGLRSLNEIGMQRQQLGSQALGQAGHLDMAQAKLAMDAYDRQYQMQLAQMQAEQGQGQGMGALLGTALGAVGGYYLGGAQGAMTGMQAGGQLGGGMMGLASYKPMPTYRPPGFGGAGAGGGGGYTYKPYKPGTY